MGLGLGLRVRVGGRNSVSAAFLEEFVLGVRQFAGHLQSGVRVRVRAGCRGIKVGKVRETTTVTMCEYME